MSSMPSAVSTTNMMIVSVLTSTNAWELWSYITMSFSYLASILHCKLVSLALVDVINLCRSVPRTQTKQQPLISSLSDTKTINKTCATGNKCEGPPLNINKLILIPHLWNNEGWWCPNSSEIDTFGTAVTWLFLIFKLAKMKFPN